MEKKILIVGTQPYNKNIQSRAFESYFHNFKKENLRQIFSSRNIPPKGHCESLYQITDERLIKKRFNRKINVGKFFNYADLSESPIILNTALSKVSKTKGPFQKLIRKLVWKKKYWLTDSLEKWIDEFKPEVIFIAWSNDFFILEIAEYFSKKLSIPIISCIGDDYILNDHFSLSPFYHIYRRKYIKLAKRLITTKGNSCIYVDDKIRDAYNSYFNVNGKTVHIASEKQYQEFQKPKSIKRMSYFGNLAYSRYKTLFVLAETLQKLGLDYQIDVYSNQPSKKISRLFSKLSNIHFNGTIPYSMIDSKVALTDILLIVESLDDKKSIADVRYSLSTKVADSLSYGKIVLGIGDKETGAMDYLIRNNCALVATSKKELEDILVHLKDEKIELSSIMSRAQKVFNEDFSLNNSCAIFEEQIDKLVEGKVNGNE